MIILDTVGDTLKAEASAASSLTVTAYGMETASAVTTYKKLGQAQLTGAGTQDILYTVPASTSTVCSVLIIANTSVTGRTVNIWHVPNAGAHGNANALFVGLNIPANSTVTWNKGELSNTAITVPQSWDAGLDDIAALAVTDGNIIVGNGTNWVAESGATARTSLGLGTIATQAANNVSISGGAITGITDLAVADGGTGLSAIPTLLSLEGLTIAAGTLVYGTAADTVAALAAGATTAILVGGGAAAPVWTAATGTGAPVRATSPTLVTPALGTPSALVGTNISGTAASLTAGNVTTNANLTGPITSVGNATSVAAQTGTGSTFVMSVSPSLTTPNLGTPSAGVLTSATGLPLTTGVTGTLPIANGGTNSTTGSITGTGALTFAAGGTAQNVTLTPSTTGYTILNGNVGIGVTPGAKLNLHNSGNNGFALSDDAVDHGITSITGTNTFARWAYYSSTWGGFQLRGLSDGDSIAALLVGTIGDISTTQPAVVIQGTKKSGTTQTALTGSEPLLDILTTIGSPLLRVQGGGNVGIGTTGPLTLTEIQGGLTTTGAILTLSSKETSTVANDVLGRINFRAALDAAGGDAILTGASIVARAEGTFSASVNTTSLDFQTGASEVATTKMTLMSDGGLKLVSIKSGATQGAAGAAATELWKTASHATLPDNVVLIGV